MTADLKTQILVSHIDSYGTFNCSQCGSSYIPLPDIENLEDDINVLPQVWCVYGCGYTFLKVKKYDRDFHDGKQETFIKKLKVKQDGKVY